MIVLHRSKNLVQESKACVEDMGWVGVNQSETRTFQISVIGPDQYSTDRLQAQALTSELYNTEAFSIQGVHKFK